VINSLIKRASVYHQQEQVEKSFEDLKQAEKIDPNCSQIFHHRAQVITKVIRSKKCSLIIIITCFSLQIYLLETNGEKAVEDFKRSVELNPQFILSAVQCCYAQYLHAKQTSNELDIEKFLRKLKGFIIQYPDHAESYTLYGQVKIILLYFL